MQGRIIKGISGFYYVKTADDKVYECHARGIFRKEKIKPYIGDIVEFSETAGSIDKIFSRKNMLIRPPVSNIDILAIVIAAAEPNPDGFLTDKLILNAEIAGIKPLICINKTDIKTPDEYEKIYKSAGYDVLTLSAKNPDEVKKILPYIENKTTAFAGMSGVGKSSILEALTGDKRETGEISEKIKRGRHTTRCVELIELKNGGYVLDTPGFSSFDVTEIKAESLQNYFPEMRDIGHLCRFNGCLHISEPDCEVKRLVESGKICESRYESYKIIVEKLKNIKEWEN